MGQWVSLLPTCELDPDLDPTPSVFEIQAANRDPYPEY